MARSKQVPAVNDQEHVGQSPSGPRLPRTRPGPPGPAFGITLDRLAGTDFSAGRPLVILSLTFLLVRLPLLGGGYGADTDAWRVVLTGRYFWSTGEYLPSRLPGFPLHESVTTLLMWGGPWLTNLSTALAALTGVLVFARLARVLAVPSSGLAVLGFAFAPYLVVTSTATLDYHWALAAVLGAYLAITRDRMVLAGALLGVAAGFRITSLVFLLPMLVLLIRTHTVRDAVIVASVTCGLGFVLYLPVAIPYRFRFLDYADSSVSPDGVIRVVGQWALGAIGAVAVLAALVLSWRRVAVLLRDLRRDPHVLTWLLSVAVVVAVFLRLPVDLGYLVPLYPFGFLLLTRALSRGLFAAVLVLTAVAGFVDLDIQQLHNFDPRIAARTVRPSWDVAGIPHDWTGRRQWRGFARAIPAAAVPEHSVVLTGGAFPVVAVLSWDNLAYAIVERDRRAISMLSDNGSLTDERHDVVYLAVSTPELLDRYRANGYTIYRADPIGSRWEDVLLSPVPP